MIKCRYRLTTFFSFTARERTKRLIPFQKWSPLAKFRHKLGMFHPQGVSTLNLFITSAPYFVMNDIIQFI